MHYYPADQTEIAERVRHKNSLGFTDVTATEEPHERTTKFCSLILPKIVEPMAKKWKENEASLLAYAKGEMNLAQLYNAIGSPAAGNWQDHSDGQ